MRVLVRGSSVGGPPGVGDTDMLGVDTIEVEVSLLCQDLVLELLDFAS